MIVSLTNKELKSYLINQLNNFFPDNKKINLSIFEKALNEALEKVEFCFKNIKLNYYWKEDKPFFNHLNADHYVIFIYYMSNITYERYNDISLSSKLFYLNKILHSFHCMYDTKLPNIFIVIHGSGIVLGKANYEDYLVVMHGVTVGSNSKWEIPTIGKNVVMYPYSSILGNCYISESTCFSNGSKVLDSDSAINDLIISNGDKVIIKKQKKCKSKIYFN